MKTYTIEVSDENEVLLAKSGADVQAVLENKIEELANQGRKVLHEEVVEAFEKADELKRVEFETLVADVKAVEEAKVVAKEVVKEVMEEVVKEKVVVKEIIKGVIAE